ncbi:hypothetical protein [Halostagnicola sp. A-GB9-2]|uniref:hypothetical protein n=1 Tax=Halostagnicola sp. A-GB9-2 TaxID=3048066 RepID=UPI0024BFF902|nr:hypothetical protein [Halostagnicola sp. A-GB9-2]MDJ1434771.1 hypothetical protein [Halostagnicola sp. A-GB9-2]
MTFEHLTSRMSLDASDYSSGADEAADASEDVSGATGEMSESLFDVEPAGVAAGGALAGLGTAAQGILDDTRETRESLDRTAQTLDITSEEARGLATSMSDATFPLEDVTESMDNLSGMVETPERMEEVALAADNVADATDTSASSITNDLAPAVNALDGDLDTIVENQDAFTLAARETNMSIEDIGNTLSKLDFAQLEEMGLQSDEVAGLMSQFADETGYSGRQLESNFNSAVEEADGDLEALTDELGLGEDAIDDWNQQVEDAEGITDDHADAVSENTSTMDELRSGFEDAKLAASGYLGPLESLMPAAQAAGIAMMGMSTINFSAVAPSFAAVSTAAAPITAVVLGLAAAVTAAYVIWERDLGGIQDRTETARDVVTGAIGGVVDFVGDAFETIDYILTDWDPAETVDNATDEVLDIFYNWHPAGIVWDKRDEIMEAIPTATDVREQMGDIVGEMGDTAGGFLSDSWNAVIPSEVGVDPVTLPTVDVDAGPLGSTTVGGQTVFDGVSFDLPQLATGGRITGDGVFRGGEEGDELVLNADQTADVDKGEVDLGGGSGEIVQRLEQILVEIRALSGPQEIEGTLNLDGWEGDVRGVVQDENRRDARRNRAQN